jgi:acyl transferase domain-containing protein/3-hydroxymyristoyl/3-hydroxydecanoyl-(acyl carrier protein) dehydratase
MGGIFPSSPSPEQLWANVLAAVDTSREVPAGRWLLGPDEVYDPTPGLPDRVYSRRGCFLDAFTVEATGLDLPADLLRGLDPVFHLTLHAGRQAFQSAVTHHLDRSRVGVILGNIVLPTEKASALAREILGRTLAEKLGLPGADRDRLGAMAPLNRYAAGLPAGVLARALRLGGGSFTLDAACASSLYALKLAVDELRAGRADAMLAGGVSRPDCLYTQMGFSQLRALSPSGRCFPFDARANGLVVGEGAGIFLLKRLADARRDGDRILAIIAGIGLSNDIGGSLLAPDSEGQLRAMREAYHQAGWSPHDVDLIECHATGTPVGDAVEYRSLRALWEANGWERGRCVIGSVKSTVGHLLTAAGAAAVTKVLHAFRDATLPPTANFASPAPGIDLEDSPFRILTQACPWHQRDGRTPRRAAVSAFGFGGINAHLLLEVPPPDRGSPLAASHDRRETASGDPPADVAVVGLDARFGPWRSLRAFQERVLGGDASRQPQVPGNWWGVAESVWFREQGLADTPFAGFFLDELHVDPEEFRIPPRELQEMLPQQLLMLQVAAAAMRRGNLREEQRQRTGVFIGLGLDLNTTNFHFRWSVLAQGKTVADAAGPPLSANRTMGALGSIVASRIAREFHLGGPSFTVSSEESSGLSALAVAVRALRRGDIDQAVVGAVDLAGDVRSVLTTHRQPLIGEGAAAVLLKRLDDALRDGDHIRAVIKGVEASSGGSIGELIADPETIGGAEADIGHAGAASSLASFVKACLCLDRRVLPPGHNCADGPRQGLVRSSGVDGTCVQVILDEWESDEDLQPLSAIEESTPRVSSRTFVVPIGGRPFDVPPSLYETTPIANGQPTAEIDAGEIAPLITQSAAAQQAHGEAHGAYLRYADAINRTLADNLAFQNVLLEALSARGTTWFSREPPASAPPALAGGSRLNGGLTHPVALNRAQCLEFAVGSIARVLGPEYAPIDAFPTRVRLPAEPLMLVDRILRIEGEPRSLTSGRVVTEHDILPDSWYLDGGCIPTSLAVESGQADLFLAGYLGIDLHTRGLAVYRLLDAAVTFHRGLPGPGAVLHYDIHIDDFFRQGDTYLFRFRFEGTVNGEPLLTMTNGCAGFFTAAALAGGKGVVQTELDRRPMRGVEPDDEAELPPMAVASYSERQLTALRHGDLAGCFGPLFARLGLHDPLRIPGGRMKLVDRVTLLDPRGGRFGIGLIRAEADIRPDAWFLTCHFVDDQVMPGTLMYECCLHTLRIYLLRLGWVGEQEQVVCEPVPGVASQLKCRGQVTAATRTVTYEVMLKERGYRPEPYAIVDALMYADGKPIVEITSMSIRLSGLTRETVRAVWARRARADDRPAPPRPFFDKDRILAFAVGKPSGAFGEPYRVFDKDRVIARLPGPPYQFLDRITRVEAQPWKMVAGGVAEAQYDVPRDAWYFAADRQRAVPFAVLLEIALQSCGWLAAYLGSALTSPVDLSFRNLGGAAELKELVRPDAGTLTTTARLRSVSSSGGMIIQQYDFVMRNAGRIVYHGETTFGFFTKAALAQQVGIRDARPCEPSDAERGQGWSGAYPRGAPFPDDRLRMVDRIDLYAPAGGPLGLGLVQATKPVDPDDWFFQAHFYQDPVCPGSLGLESLVQLLKFVAVERWRGGPAAAFEAMLGRRHRWVYRGQVIPANKRVAVQAVVTSRDDAARRLTANGFLLVDDRAIYQMDDFSLRMTDG